MNEPTGRDAVASLIAARVPRDLRGLRLAEDAEGEMAGAVSEDDLERSMSRNIEMLERCQTRLALKLASDGHADLPS